MTPDFIEIYDDALPAGLCAEIIERFEASPHKQAGRTGHGVDPSKKKSSDVSLTLHPEWQDVQARIVDATFPFLERYMASYAFALVGALSPTVRDPERGEPVTLTMDNFDRLGRPLLRGLIPQMYRYGAVTVQKYAAREGGYPHWHSEVYPQDERCEPLHRVLFWIYYLNDVAEGGETEFAYQQRKVEPRAGRLLMAPAGFTHTHRGAIPRSNDKYVLTSWVMFQRAETLFRQR